MAGYRITIVGHLDVWRLPPDGSLPAEARQVFNVDAESDRALNEFIDQRIGDIVASGAMKAYRNPEDRTIGKMNDWFTVPGSVSTDSVQINISPAQPNVFYRMAHP